MFHREIVGFQELGKPRADELFMTGYGFGVDKEFVKIEYCVFFVTNKQRRAQRLLEGAGAFCRSSKQQKTYSGGQKASESHRGGLGFGFNDSRSL